MKNQHNSSQFECNRIDLGSAAFQGHLYSLHSSLMKKVIKKMKNSVFLGEIMGNMIPYLDICILEIKTLFGQCMQIKKITTDKTSH